MMGKFIDDFGGWCGWYCCGITEDTCYMPSLWRCPVLCACCPFVACGFTSNWILDKLDQNAQERRLAARIPKPLPKKRKRALTLPLFHPSPTLITSSVHFPLRTSPHVEDQTSRSPLFKLSIELRQMIYQEIFRAGLIHVAVLLPEGRMGHIKCRESEPDKIIHGCFGRENENNFHVDAGDRFDRDDQNIGAIRHGEELLPLLMTCRQVYTEAIDLLYSSHTFSFRSPEHLVYFSTTILPRRLNSIRSIQLNYMFDVRVPALRRLGDNDLWSQSWTVIAGMEGLRELHLRIGVNRYPESLTPEIISLLEKKLLGRLTAERATDRGIQILKVEAPWREQSWLQEVKGTLPFRIEWHVRSCIVTSPA